MQPSTQSAIQSVKNDNELSPKCKNCTLEELAVLRIMQQNPSVTQKQIAALIGKSERTVKTLTIHMTEKGIIIRRNGKRNGYWEILSEWYISTLSSNKLNSPFVYQARVANLFITLHPTPEKSLQKAISLAQFKIIHYLCTAKVNQQEIVSVAHD